MYIITAITAPNINTTSEYWRTTGSAESVTTSSSGNVKALLKIQCFLTTDTPSLLPLYFQVKSLHFFSLECWKGPLQCCPHRRVFSIIAGEAILRFDVLSNTNNDLCKIRTLNFITSPVLLFTWLQQLLFQHFSIIHYKLTVNIHGE